MAVRCGCCCWLRRPALKAVHTWPFEGTAAYSYTCCSRALLLLLLTVLPSCLLCMQPSWVLRSACWPILCGWRSSGGKTLPPMHWQSGRAAAAPCFCCWCCFPCPQNSCSLPCSGGPGTNSCPPPPSGTLDSSPALSLDVAALAGSPAPSLPCRCEGPLPAALSPIVPTARPAPCGRGSSCARPPSPSRPWPTDPIPLS